MHEKHTRSVAKGISWRVIASLTTMILVYIFTGRLEMAAGIGLLEVISKLLFYYGHERIWNHIKWGKINRG